MKKIKMFFIKLFRYNGRNKYLNARLWKSLTKNDTITARNLYQRNSGEI